MFILLVLTLVLFFPLPASAQDEEAFNNGFRDGFASGLGNGLMKKCATTIYEELAVKRNLTQEKTNQYIAYVCPCTEKRTLAEFEDRHDGRDGAKERLMNVEGIQEFAEIYASNIKLCMSEGLQALK
jgi:hypothetical protein